jgi:hypothetical protein
VPEDDQQRDEDRLLVRLVISQAPRDASSRRVGHRLAIQMPRKARLASGAKARVTAATAAWLHNAFS